MRIAPMLVERILIRECFDGGRLFRVVHVDDASDRIWLFDVNAQTWPEPYDRALLTAGFLESPATHVIEYDEPIPTRLSKQGAVSGSRTDRAHQRQWDIINHLTADGGERELLFPAARKGRIKAAVDAYDVTRPTVVTAIMRYWQRGMTFDAIRPDYSKCGGPGKQRNITSGRKVGRPRSISPGIGISVNDDLRRKMQAGVDFYLNTKKPSQQEALDLVVRLYFSHLVEDANGIRVEVMEEKPTLAQFNYHLANFRSLSKRFKARHGRQKYKLEGRAIVGKGDQNTQGPGDKFQIDATIADVYLRSQFDRRRIVGRPVIYFVIDVWSRLIVGVYIGFEGPSWVGAMMALTNMVTPKKEFCRQYDIEIEEDDWPSHHAPRTILADRGELMSVQLGENIVNSLRIQIENTSPGRGDLKGIVERRFRVVPSIFKQFTPGYVEPDFGKRGADDYRLDAAMNLKEFTQIVIHAILQHNRETIDDLQVPAEMTTEGLSAIPLDLWKWGIENRSGALRQLPLVDVALAVMPTDTARVTAKGIRFHGGFYSCDAAESGGWFSKARLKGDWPVEVSYDPRSLDKLYIWDPKSPRGYETCWLLDPYADLIGKSLFEYQEKTDGAKRVAAAGADKRQAKRIETDIEMEKIEKAARAETEAVVDKGASFASQTSGIRKNRTTEVALQRPIEKIDLSPTLEPPSTPVHAELQEPVDEYETDLLATLRQIETNAKRTEG